MRNRSMSTLGGAFLGYRIGRENKRADPRKYQRGPTDVPPTHQARSLMCRIKSWPLVTSAGNLMGFSTIS